MGWGGVGWARGNDVDFATMPMNFVSMQAIIIIIVLRHTKSWREQYVHISNISIIIIMIMIIIIVIIIIIIIIVIVAFPLRSVSILQSSCRRSLVGWQTPRARRNLQNKRPAAHFAFRRFAISHWCQCFRASTQHPGKEAALSKRPKPTFSSKKCTQSHVYRVCKSSAPMESAKTPWSLRRVLPFVGVPSQSSKVKGDGSDMFRTL